MYCTGDMSSRNRPEWISMAISQNEISEQARVLSCNAVSMACYQEFNPFLYLFHIMRNAEDGS